MRCEKGPRGVLYWKNQYETHVCHLARDAKNDRKSTQQPPETHLWAIQAAYTQNSALEGLQLRFWKVFGTSGPLLGGFWSLLGSSWAFLEGSQGLFGAVLEAHWAPQRPPERSRRGPGTWLAAYQAENGKITKVAHSTKDLLGFGSPSASLWRLKLSQNEL